MREYIEENLTVIRKYLKKRKEYTSKLNNASIMEEFKEFIIIKKSLFILNIKKIF